MNETGNRCAEVTRKLKAGEPLAGELLEFARGLVPDPRGDKDDELWADMAQKLTGGQPLSAYGHHLMVDVFLLHVSLQAEHAEAAPLREAARRLLSGD